MRKDWCSKSLTSREGCDILCSSAKIDKCHGMKGRSKSKVEKSVRTETEGDDESQDPASGKKWDGKKIWRRGAVNEWRRIVDTVPALG